MMDKLIMKFLHQMLLLFICAINPSFQSAPTVQRVTFLELENLNANCSDYESCFQREYKPWSTKCRCEHLCVHFGNCCFDAKYAVLPKPKFRQACRHVNGNAYSFYYMVDQCPQQIDGSKNVYDDLCKEDWNGQNDVMRIIPVTSLFTHITYKNYFCFRCHESGQDHVFWNALIKFNGETDMKEETGNVPLEYDNYDQTWYSPIGPGESWVPVDLKIELPFFIYPVVGTCYPRLISNCSEFWHDDDVKSKCDSYMYATTIKRDSFNFEYRNPHCALCNYESMDNLFCPARGVSVGGSHGGASVSGGYGGSHAVSSSGKKPFSFTFLLDINRSDGDKVGQIQRCRDGDIWDPFFVKCRTPKCALPHYTIQDGICAPS